MFVARESELAALEESWARPRFEMAVIYGRRRVGKTSLVNQFARDKPVLSFTALQQDEPLALARFSRSAYAFFGDPADLPSFVSWEQAFSYIARMADRFGHRFLVVFDEFPYAAQASPSLASELQVAIDTQLKQKNVMLVLSGSNVGFMESHVLGSKSPLYGRRTLQIRLRPFDAFDAARMLPGCSAEDLVAYYAILGGTPYYLEQVIPELSLEQNVERLFFRESGVLFAEPEMLLRQELRDPSTYNSLLTLCAQGRNTPKEMGDVLRTSSANISSHLRVLRDLGLLERVAPFGKDPATSKEAVYRLAEPLFDFWHTFVAPAADVIGLGAGAQAARAACEPQALMTYVGPHFEQVCTQWVLRQSGRGELPFLVTRFGRWWGTSPVSRTQCDLDLVCAGPGHGNVLVGECKWRNRFNEKDEVEKLVQNAPLAGRFDERQLYFFSKRPVSEATLARDGGRVRFLCAGQLFSTAG